MSEVKEAVFISINELEKAIIDCIEKEENQFYLKLEKTGMPDFNILFSLYDRLVNKRVESFIFSRFSVTSMKCFLVRELARDEMLRSECGYVFPIFYQILEQTVNRLVEKNQLIKLVVGNGTYFFSGKCFMVYIKDHLETKIQDKLYDANRQLCVLNKVVNDLVNSLAEVKKI